LTCPHKKEREIEIRTSDLCFMKCGLQNFNTGLPSPLSL